MTDLSRSIELWVTLALLCSSAVGFVVMKLKTRTARARLAAIASGALCIACEASDVMSEGTGVHCNRCGYLTSAQLRSAPVSDAEIALLSRPDDRGENGLFAPKPPIKTHRDA